MDGKLNIYLLVCFVFVYVIACKNLYLKLCGICIYCILGFDFTLSHPHDKDLPPPPGGTQIIFLAGCAAQGLKPLPLCKDFSPPKNDWFDCFSEIFANWDPFLRVFTSKTAGFSIFFTILVIWDPLLRIFWPKLNLCLRIFGEKVTHLGSTSPYALTSEYPPPPPGPARLVIHRSWGKSTGFPILTLWISQKSTGPPNFLITKLAGTPGNSWVGTGRPIVKSIPDIWWA